MASYPLPRPKTGPPATHNGLPVYGFSAPVLRHVCRYVESDETGRFRLGFRTARARQVRIFPAQNKLGMKIGNAAVLYPIDKLFTARDLVNAGGSEAGRTPKDRVVRWSGMLYPEGSGSGWVVGSADAEEVMGQGGAFDLDDRGYLYAGFPDFGWGISKDDGRTTGSQYPFVVQIEGGTEVSPHSVVSVRVGETYYAVVAGQVNSCAVYNVTDPANPQLVGQPRTAPKDGIRKYDRTADRIAWVDGGNRVHIATNAGLVAGTPTVSVPGTERGGFIDVAFDEAGNVWAVEDSLLWRITPAGVKTSFPVFSGLRGIRTVAAGAGYVAVVGTDRADITYDVKLARIEANGPVLVPTDSFFKNYYFPHGNRTDLARPGRYASPPCDLALFSHGGKTYLFCAFEGLGDVLELAPRDLTIPPPPPPDALIAECRRLAEEQITAATNRVSANLAPFAAALDRLRTRP